VQRHRQTKPYPRTSKLSVRAQTQTNKTIIPHNNHAISTCTNTGKHSNTHTQHLPLTWYANSDKSFLLLLPPEYFQTREPILFKSMTRRRKIVEKMRYRVCTITKQLYKQTISHYTYFMRVQLSVGLWQRIQTSVMRGFGQKHVNTSFTINESLLGLASAAISWLNNSIILRSYGRVISKEKNHGAMTQVLTLSLLPYVFFLRDIFQLQLNCGPIFARYSAASKTDHRSRLM